MLANQGHPYIHSTTVLCDITRKHSPCEHNLLLSSQKLAVQQGLVAVIACKYGKGGIVYLTGVSLIKKNRYAAGTIPRAHLFEVANGCVVQSIGSLY